jgi:hypothetical protein
VHAVEELVERALEGRRDELRAIVQREVDARLAALVDELITTELELRRNGSTGLVQPAPSPAPSSTTATKVCRRCGGTKPLAAFVPRRAVCRACRNADRQAARARAKATADDEDPHPAPRRGRQQGMRLVSHDELTRAEQRRAVIAAAPTSLIERDGRTFMLRRLPVVHDANGNGHHVVRARVLRPGTRIA